MENNITNILIRKALLLAESYNDQLSIGYNKNDYSITHYHLRINGSSFTVKYKNLILGKFYTNLFGIEGINHALDAIIFCYENGIDLKIMQSVLSDVEDNQLLLYQRNKIIGVVCDVNSFNSLNNLLMNIKRIKHNRLILVAGLSGNQITKRAVYGEIASNKSDILILTENNCHYESIFSILYDTTINITKDFYIELDRKKAIELAAKLSKPNDIILIIGKGCNNYDKILNYTFKHNDYEILKEALDT